MKSAYELAMERLQQESGPLRKLTKEQKTRIAEIEKKFAAKVAETKLSFDERITKAASNKEYQEAQANLAHELRSIEEAREREKENVWSE
jgi:hypothetical protein